MDIPHAFLPENIQAADVGLTEEEIDELREFVTEMVGTTIREKQQGNTGDDWNAVTVYLDAVVHAFVAGRCWQQEQIDEQVSAVPVQVEMTPREAELYIRWLSERVQ